MTSISSESTLNRLSISCYKHIFTFYTTNNYATPCFAFRFGSLNVTVTIKRQALMQEPLHESHVMKFKKFLIDYRFEEWYLVTPIPKKMMTELPVSII